MKGVPVADEDRGAVLGLAGVDGLLHPVDVPAERADEVGHLLGHLERLLGQRRAAAGEAHRGARPAAPRPAGAPRAAPARPAPPPGTWTGCSASAGPPPASSTAAATARTPISLRTRPTLGRCARGRESGVEGKRG